MAEIVIVADAAAAGAIVADEIARLVRANPEAVLGLATGSTPVPVYAALPSRLAGVDVSRVRGFALDEYVGLDPAHPESYRSVITREVVEPLGLDPARVRVPNGSLEGIEHAGDDYERALAEAGGVDLQILGIGTDGHIGFNEPGSSFASATRVKTLTRQTRQDNARFFDSIDDVPRHCITQGLGTILRARHLVLLAFGEGQGRGGRRCGRRSGDSVAPGIRDPAAPARHGGHRRRGGIRSALRRVLPLHVREQARLAGPVAIPRAARGRSPQSPANRAPFGAADAGNCVGCGRRMPGRTRRGPPRRTYRRGMTLPDDLLALLRAKSTCYIATLMKDGSPQLTQVWVDTDGEHVIVNSVDTHLKVRNLRRDPRVAVTISDPAHPGGFYQVRGRAISITEEGGPEHIEMMAQKYTGGSYPWYGGRDQVRVVITIEAEKVSSTGR